MLRARHGLALCLLAVGTAATAQVQDPAVIMEQLEARVLAARRVLVDADIEASGAVTARLTGHGELLDRNRAALAYAGSFGGNPVELGLSTDGRILQWRRGGDTREEAVARESNRALLLGLTRMGLLHNLSRGLPGLDAVRAGEAPDIALDSFRPTTFVLGGELEGSMSFGFDVMAGADVAGAVRLWLHPVSGLPRRRQLTVRLARGDLTVIEDYRRFLLE